MNFIGWIFFLLFLGFLLYFFGGMLIMKMRGAEGIQIIPHYTFWITLPFKLKSAVTYCFNGCRPQSDGYDEI